MRHVCASVCGAVLLLGVSTGSVWAHGVAGKRFFPATIAIDDPAVNDELALPSVSHIKGPDGKETDIGAELSKTITPNLAVSVGATYQILDPVDPEEKSTSGFANPHVGLKYMLLRQDEHEILISLGFDWEIGGAGDKSVGAPSFSTVRPALFFGKGLGDLPEAVRWLRPFAVTGTVGADVPLGNDSNVLAYGFTIQYSLQYLQAYVQDIGLPAPFNRMIPLVEFAFQTPLEGDDKGRTTWTINPGIIWAGRFMEIGVEAIIPGNDRTGKNVGVAALVHFFLDDMFPSIFHPIFP
jgi:hypothetical protein